MSSGYRDPPHLKNYDNDPRQFGLEIEFGTVRVGEAAELVKDMFGGDIIEKNPHRFVIEDTSLGDFLVELDFSFVHPNHEGDDDDDLMRDLGKKLRNFIGDISRSIVPSEIVCPPVPFEAISKIEKLVANLAEKGASGTSDNPLYGFGFQINPEIADKEGDYILRVFKSYLLLSDWLRAVIKLDLTRQAIAFADPFARSYVRKVVDPDYWPDHETFIDDYLKDNPTRNRELDMLPLFSWLDDARVKSVIDDPLVKARPTFHYRLPNADISSPDWSLKREWNRWCLVERLAEDCDKLKAMGKAYKRNDNKFLADNWAILASEWIML